MGRTRRAVYAVVAMTLLSVSCTGDRPPSPPSERPERGGVYRTAVPDFGFTDGLDPTGEYSSVGWELYTGLLRALLTYRHVGGPAGNVPVPDLATSLPVVSDGGLTYTFHLKSDVRFGPPVDRPITSQDIEYAFGRIDTASLIAQYGQFYDGTIVGMNGPHGGPPTPISGIETPDDRTIVFHLTRPTGDFLYRLTLPATAPVPQEVAQCFQEAGEYGRYLISSGPYMLAGSGALDTSSCAAMRPIAGFDPTRQIVLVRNPAYDPDTDSPAVRSNFVHGIEISINTNLGDIFNKIQVSELDGSLNPDAPPPNVLERHLTDPGLRPYLQVDPAEVTSFISMNLTTPPFDDVHVRRAVSYAVDKAGLLQASGGPVHGTIATHIIPPLLLPGRLESFDPYPSPGHSGDLARARAEMRSSAYDTNGDGLCDRSACRGVTLLSVTSSPYTEMEPVVAEDLERIRIEVSVRELDAGAAFQALSDVKARVPIALFPSYGKDYADPYSFARIFSSRSIQPVGGVNFSLVGLSPDMARDLGVPYPPTGVPNVDGQITSCEEKMGESRLECWADLDRHLMEDVVPWVPYAWLNIVSVMASTVTRYEFDQFSGNPSITQIAVNNGLEPTA